MLEIQELYERSEYIWEPNPQGVDEFKSRQPIPEFQGLSGNYEEKDTLLWTYLLKNHSRYRRGAQGIGDCVAWGSELAATILRAKHASEHLEAATEPIYGGSRVEARGKSGDGRTAVGGWSDGSYGAAAAEWLKRWGVVWREDHSATTGNRNHDYRKYDSRKAKNEGAYGAGGKGDAGAIDKIARSFPLKTVSQTRGFDDVAKIISGSKCPVTNASLYGTNMRRDSKGQCYWNNRWPHQMCWIGVRFGSHPAILNAQSWGPNVASGPSGDEFIDWGSIPGWDHTPENILGFCWWMPAEDVDRVCRSGDCWGYGDIEGEWKVDKFDWSTMWG